MEEKEEKQEELFIPKTKHKGLKIIIGIILIAGLAVGGYFLYQHKFNNPKTIVNNVLEDAKSDLQQALVTDVGNKKYKVDGHLKVDTNITDDVSGFNDLIKNLELQFNGEVDPTNSIGNITINAKYKNEKMIEMQSYFEKNIAYLLLNGIYDKYLKIDTSGEYESDLASIVPEIDINPKDIQTLLNSIITATEKEVNKLDIKKSDTTITIDGKDIDVIDNYIELKDKEVTNFIKAIMNDLKEDKDFADTLKKLTGDDISDILKSLTVGAADDGFIGTYKISFYTDKGLLNKKIVSVKQSITVSGITMTYDVNKISDDEIEVVMSAMGASYSIRVKKNNSVFNIILNESVMGMYLKVELNMNYEEIKEITKPDISNSKDINDLTEKEQKEIEENLMKNKVLSKFVEELNKAIPKGESEA